MKLFIIGNGFDKGHGLATTYWDFRTYLKNLYSDFLYTFEEHYCIYPSMEENTKKELLWNELETNLANIDEDVIIEQAVSIDMGLESGDVGIEDTLYEYLADKYKYIQFLAKCLKQWARTIRIRDVERRTTLINEIEDAIYITFNYTAVLETVYKISEGKIIHIHGSLRQRDGAPILGHGNKARIEKIKEKLQDAEREFDEKRVSICKVVEDYYSQTYKDINRYMYKLFDLIKKDVNEIMVIGHSLAGVDIPYFKNIDLFTHQQAIWKVYYHRDKERQIMFDSLVSCGIDSKRIELQPSDKFYDL
ncbi:bacteriophage abortive infection AbiH family protein [Metallumcola ferriviriculae]|uniref:Bacteriophage abortive infection AbiH family protein n=1 Tax=Metallumcola ferriviriculae TaxID=3039180 RepID=A0AAU0UR23_9FIRM|nr:bacteriophage abortive infection AbiH family protein [Desulfitibacteraceae bacterium MK1]